MRSPSTGPGRPSVRWLELACDDHLNPKVCVAVVANAEAAAMTFIQVG